MIYRSPGHQTSGPAARVTPYAPNEVDCVVTYVRGNWYLYLEPHKFPNNVYIYAYKIDKARNNWSAIGLSTNPVISFDLVA